MINQYITDVDSEFDPIEEILSQSINKEKYAALSEIEKAELALNLYISNKTRKSKWQIGRDYELSVGYEYELNGFIVEYYGIEKKLEDLGRDLIAHREQTILIIQCKYWKEGKEIRENHISQLFGTAKQYEMEVNNESVGLFKKHVIPKIITSSKLSDTALKFAKYLGVEVEEQRGFKEFPRVKCNATKQPDGTISKIFHLPMDQQYDKTLIKNPGEYRVATVAEAMELGFRRAYRYSGFKKG